MEENKKPKPRKVLELTIEKKACIEEAFGGNPDQMHEIRENFTKFLAFEQHDSYTEAWATFLESDLFKRTGWTPKTPNDYFILGWIFSGAKYKYTKIMEAMRGGDSSRRTSLRPCDLLRMLAD